MISQVSVLPMPPPTQAERRKPEMAEDQRPAEQRVDARFRQCSATARRAAARAPKRSCAAAGTAATARCTTCRRAGTSGPARAARGDWPKARMRSADMPQQQPVRRHADRDQPQPGAESPADVAHGVEALSERGRHHRRRGDDQAEQEDVEGEGEIERERRRRELGRAEPAHQQDVGRLDRLLGEVGEDQRPGERQRRAQLVAPRAAPFAAEIFAALSIG